MGKDLESELEMPTDDKPEEESVFIQAGGNTTIIHDEESHEEARITQEMFRKIDADLQYQYGGMGKPLKNFLERIVEEIELDWQAGRETGGDLEDYIARHREWSYKTFGPGSRAEGLLKHIRKELLEIEADPGDLMEWVDVMILAIDGAWRAGFSPFDVAEALKRKQAINFNRAWPDWRKAQEGEPIEHEKGGTK